MYNNLPKTLFIGKSVIYLPTCHSTNEVASTLLSKPEIFEGTVVVCSEQTAGKGQRGNTWEAEPNKNLTFSLILKPKFLKVNQQFNLNIAISLAVYDLLTKYLGEKVRIKWPNDIYYLNNPTPQKICGILIQNIIKGDSIENSIVGIGLNVNQSIFGDPKAISLFNILQKELSTEEVLIDLMEKIEPRYLQLKDNLNGLIDDYLRWMFWYKEKHIFKSEAEFQGTIVGLDPIGRLLIESEGDVKAYNFKEIAFVK